MNKYHLRLRFLLEIIVLFSIGMFSWTQFHGFVKYLLLFSLPAIIIIVWTVFAVPGDPSRNGETIVAVNGVIRIIIETIIFALEILAFYFSGFKLYSLLFFIVLAFIMKVQLIV